MDSLSTEDLENLPAMASMLAPDATAEMAVDSDNEVVKQSAEAEDAPSSGLEVEPRRDGRRGEEASETRGDEEEGKED